MTRLAAHDFGFAFNDGAARHDVRGQGHLVIQAQRSHHFGIKTGASACQSSAGSYRF
ncbi:MAG TPA: hypothetical protein PLA28_05665 [Ottowia sp.]|nr:hypothetical protein [Ottowia sp.]